MYKKKKSGVIGIVVTVIILILLVILMKNTLKCFMIQCMNKCIFINPELVLAQKFQNTLQYF